MIAVVDIGVQYTNVDLMDQYDFTSAYNFYSSNLLKGYGLVAGGAVGLPAQEMFDHGTQCAGLIAAKPNNSYCGVGIAHGSKFTSIIPFGPDALETKESLMSDAYIANGLTYRHEYIDIYTNSWGPPDIETLFMRGPGQLTKLSMRFGTVRGRRGKGILGIKNNFRHLFNIYLTSIYNYLTSIYIYLTSIYNY